MIRFRTCLLLATVGPSAVACHRAGDSDPVPAGLPGSYVYAAKGTTIKKWEFAAQLELRSDKSYAFSLDKTIDGKKDSTERSTGTYTVSGDHVLMTDPSGGKAAKDVHNLRIRADSLIPEVGWTAELFLKGVGAPNIVFVRRKRG